MRIGFALPNIGPVATPEAVIAVAERAEQLGYDSLWTIERLLYPVKLQRPYPVTADGSLPEVYKHALDPLEALTFAAARTTKIALGTSVLDIPYYNPVMLARRLTTLDFLSKGRVRVGLGLGWNKDEVDATGGDFSPRQVLPSARVLHWSQAGAEATPAHLHGGLCTTGAKAPGHVRRRLESSGYAAGRHGADVRFNQAAREGSGARSVTYRAGHPGTSRNC
jgi:hypothetical protein